MYQILIFDFVAFLGIVIGSGTTGNLTGFRPHLERLPFRLSLHLERLPFRLSLHLERLPFRLSLQLLLGGVL